MKKIYFTLCLGLAMTVSMFASTTVTLTVANFQTTSFSSQGISVEAAKANAANDPAYNSTSKDLRVYAKGTLTVSADQPITHISFTLSEQGKKRLAPLTANTGNVTVVGDPDFTVDWTGSANSVTLTVGDKADYGTENTKAGQLDFTAITVTYNGDPIDPIDPPVSNTLSCNELLSVITNSPTYYVVQGYVSTILSEYNSASHTITFGLDDEFIYLIRPEVIARSVHCSNEADAPKRGDLVWVKGQWKISPDYWSYTVAESEAGGSFGIIQRAGDVIFFYDDFDGGVESSGGEVSYMRDGVTVYTNRGYCSELAHALRVYSGALFEITSQDKVISKIRFTFDEHYDRDFSGGLSNEVIVNSKTWRVESMTSQARIIRIEVFFGGSENQAVELTPMPESTQKIISNGQILILRGDKTYTLTGQELK